MFNILAVFKDKNSIYTKEIFDNTVIEYSSLDVIKNTYNYNLCIIEADFSDENYLTRVKEFITRNTNIEFWAGSHLCKKEDIITAYSLGCKNFVKFPLSEKVLQKYFSVKDLGAGENIPNIQLEENFENMRVLVIDDNEINIELLKEVLSIFKLKAICFNNSEHALQYALGEKVDLILLDIMMPNINGFEFAEKIKQENKNKDTPIVFISALGGNENKIKGFSLGSHAYIEKPFEINTVRAQLFNILKIQKLQKQKESFIATLTHDLRTPIRAQIRALELLLENKFGELNSDQNSIIKEILSSCKFLHFMTDDLLVKYKFDNGTITIKKETNSLQKMIEDTIKSFKYLLEQKSQTVIYNYNSSIKKIDFDAIELSRVLNNLLINASEYSTEGGAIIVSVNENQQKYCLEISIEDNGCSLTREESETIFEEYNSNAKNFNKVGAGLGLFISRKIIQLHGGSIWVELSENIPGTKFVFTLPYDMVLV